MRLVLASQSPRRREMLASVGLRADVRPAHADESVHPGERPEAYVRRVARDKAEGVPAAPGELILAADTAVILGDEILGKPSDPADAGRMLRALSGRTHQVLTAVHARTCPVSGAPRHESMVVETAVTFRPLGDAEVDWYVSTGEPLDKAGAYAVQGIGGVLVREVAGSVSNVVGLPLGETLALVGRLGLPLPWEGRST